MWAYPQKGRNGAHITAWIGTSASCKLEKADIDSLDMLNANVGRGSSRRPE